jgi:four helix bundle protein
MEKGNKGYHKLIVWQKLQELLLVTYKLVEKLPKSEDFGLKSQMRRAIVSVLSNFIEGYLKRSTKEKLHFMEIAETSLFELEAQSEICFLLKYWDRNDITIFEEKRGLAGYFLN